MRDQLRGLPGCPEHVALAYSAWAPVDCSGEIPKLNREDWLDQLAELSVSADYGSFFERWAKGFDGPGHHSFKCELTSRLLVGHGNSSATGVGLTAHHTWGVPVIPGSSLKGVLAHYVSSTYGPDDPKLLPWEQQGGERERTRYQGVTWRVQRIERGPGDIYRMLFGAPDVMGDAEMRDRGLDAGASQGLVIFHDALYVPGSAPSDCPYANDVLTVHHQKYYSSSGESWPNDYKDPIPVEFLSVRPGVQVLVVLSGPDDWTALAEKLLIDALALWGVGGKTSSGYGRLIPVNQAQEAANPAGAMSANAPSAGDSIPVRLLEERTRKGGWKARHVASGISGPIQNSRDIPAGMNPGDSIEVAVKVSKGAESQFEFRG